MLKSSIPMNGLQWKPSFKNDGIGWCKNIKRVFCENEWK
jgi:hypothetical protein